MTRGAPRGITGGVENLPRSLVTEQPSGGCASDPPDAAETDYADYVERLEQQIDAGRERPDDRRAVAVDGKEMP
jgi:hypothetical protein